jgi:hypothetical protein
MHTVCVDNTRRIMDHAGQYVDTVQFGIYYVTNLMLKADLPSNDSCVVPQLRLPERDAN